jgi:hypothetical protein
MTVGMHGRDAPARGPLEHAELQQVGLVDVLDRVALLAHRDRQRREPHGPARELLADHAQDLAVQPIQSELVDLEQLERGLCDLAVTRPSPRTSA